MSERVSDLLLHVHACMEHRLCIAREGGLPLAEEDGARVVP